MLLVLCCSVHAQSEKHRTIGFLTETKRLDNAEGFVQELQKLGYFEGKNLTIVRRYATDDPARISVLAAELVRLNVDVIFAPGSAVALGAKNATNSIPIVFATVSDAVGSGLVASLARPGRNLTGLTQISPDLAGKRLELLKETVSKLSRVALLLNRKAAAKTVSLKEMEAAARQFDIQLHQSRSMMLMKSIMRTRE
jgi:putative ABC transport system substrate-binding protein